MPVIIRVLGEFVSTKNRSGHQSNGRVKRRFLMVFALMWCQACVRWAQMYTFQPQCIFNLQDLSMTTNAAKLIAPTSICDIIR